MKCPVCRYAKCRWVHLDHNALKKNSVAELRNILNHNISYIEMVSRGAQSSHNEERMYSMLSPIVQELEIREAE